MRYASIRAMDISNGEGIGVALFTQGCPIHCYNCFNQQTWDFDGGQLFTYDQEELIIQMLKPDYITRFTILGGEPLIERNIEPLYNLCLHICQAYGSSKSIWCYTGQVYEKLVSKASDKLLKLIRMFDKLIDGPYIDELKDPKLMWRGSSNQRVLDIEDLYKLHEI